MNTHTVLPFVLLALVAGALRFQPASHDLTDAERARVEHDASEFLSSYLTIIEGEDDDAIRALYVDDGRFAWYSDGEKKYSSGDEVLAGLHAMEGMTFSTEASDVEVMALTPDLAHARSHFETKILQGGAVVFEFSGVITWLLEADGDGAWRVLVGHTSTPKDRR